ncbi:MAG: hypothetical protein AUJ48_01670 [Deltaproteobacteria bacterium CG1_02_45_11]|nr:MAG: hypothetical protein AUJ48_01670 [Deltaproteobacteria bacterium CG1_02_45_11]
MKDQAKKKDAYMAQRRMIVGMIDVSFRLAEKLGRHLLTKGCNCIACIHRRKRILKITGKDWKFKL